MQWITIVLLSVLTCVTYGVVHDQITARICVEYFTIGHPPVFATDDPTLLGLGRVNRPTCAGRKTRSLSGRSMGPQRKLSCRIRRRVGDDLGDPDITQPTAPRPKTRTKKTCPVE